MHKIYTRQTQKQLQIHKINYKYQIKSNECVHKFSRKLVTSWSKGDGNEFRHVVALYLRKQRPKHVLQWGIFTNHGDYLVL